MKRIIMRPIQLSLLLVTIAIAASQTTTEAIVTNLSAANWTHEKGAVAGSEGVMLHADPKTGGMDLLVRFPAGHVIAPHFHDSNERVVVVEGQLTLRREGADAALVDTAIDTGGFAFLPAREVQRLSCSSKARCSFYLMWDGKPDSHPAR
jgi:quercetin dioxygenase-like cupin family protein